MDLQGFYEVFWFLFIKSSFKDLVKGTLRDLSEAWGLGLGFQSLCKQFRVAWHRSGEIEA